MAAKAHCPRTLAKGRIILRVGRWWIGLALVLLSTVPILFARSADPKMLEDSDTKVLLQVIRARQDPTAWFFGDWPLENHFYRPISTLVFEMDNALFGTNTAGYGWTNALLCALCVIAAFWFFRELADRVWLATASAVLFALWTVDRTYLLANLLSWVPWIILAAGTVAALRYGRRDIAALGGPLAAALTLDFFARETVGIFPLAGRVVTWLPGRTATTMTLFVFIALAAYARYERLSAARSRPQPTPLDRPATKSTVIAKLTGPIAAVWVAVSAVGLALALGAYEQAVMVPALLLGVALTMRWQGYVVRWWPQAIFWGLLLGYLVLRARLVPTEASGYQLQQFRSSVSVIWSIMDYAFPALGPLSVIRETLGVGPAIYLTATPYRVVWFLASNVVAYVEARRDWVFALAGLAMSTLAFLPMAWLKHFEHYHYLPMALRSLFVVTLGGVGVQLAINAVAPPAIPAPPRPRPAPGSLPRP